MLLQCKVLSFCSAEMEERERRTNIADHYSRVVRLMFAAKQHLKDSGSMRTKDSGLMTQNETVLPAALCLIITRHLIPSLVNQGNDSIMVFVATCEQ